MANHKSAIKAHKQSQKRNERNVSLLSRIKTFMKKLEQAITSGSKEEAQTAFKNAESQIMKGVSKGVIKKNTAARKVSRLSKKVKAKGDKSKPAKA